MQSALNSSASNHGNEIHIGSNVSSSGKFLVNYTVHSLRLHYFFIFYFHFLHTVAHSVDEQNVPRHGNLSGMMTKNSVCVSTEIADSNVENGGADSEMQTENDTNGDRMELNAPLNTECGNDKPDNEHDGIDLSTENGVAVRVKLEPKVENEIETGVMDLPVITFDPIEYNARQTSVGSRTRRSKLTGNQIQPNSSTTVQKQRNRYAAKLSKSKANAYDSHREPFGNQHQQIRDHQKSITPIKNVQTLFDCGRCMRLFSQEMEKTEHESRCRKQRYECHRCNKFVTVNKSSKLKHDQSHCA